MAAISSRVSVSTTLVGSLASRALAVVVSPSSRAQARKTTHIRQVDKGALERYQAHLFEDGSHRKRELSTFTVDGPDVAVDDLPPSAGAPVPPLVRRPGDHSSTVFEDSRRERQWTRKSRASCSSWVMTAAGASLAYRESRGSRCCHQGITEFEQPMDGGWGKVAHEAI
jgi:hypothetical protein